jgi:Na+/alanine symporter
LLPESVRAAIVWTSDAVWHPAFMGALLLGTGLFFTLRYRFLQVVRFLDALETLIPERVIYRPGRTTHPTRARPRLEEVRA